MFSNNLSYQWPTLKNCIVTISWRSLRDNLLVIGKNHLWPLLHGDPSPTKKTVIPFIPVFLGLGTPRKHSLCSKKRWNHDPFFIFENFGLLPQRYGFTIFLKYAKTKPRSWFTSLDRSLYMNMLMQGKLNKHNKKLIFFIMLIKWCNFFKEKNQHAIPQTISSYGLTILQNKKSKLWNQNTQFK